MSFLCSKCHNIIRNNPSIKNNTLTCDNCQNVIKLENKTIQIYENFQQDELPKWLYLYQYDDTVTSDYIIYKNKMIPMKDIKAIKLN